MLIEKGKNLYSNDKKDGSPFSSLDEQASYSAVSPISYFKTSQN